MDDTQQSRASDAATRKRRSSILKSQRPARTPFSELEFNVDTPTDTAKSRRVSFSRRTGVAEFVTNEATTTWKNFYEEHNKSLESSGNDSEANASRQPVGHLGKRIFDQQFEEVEAVDFISGLANGSLNNVNFTQQIASLECTGDGKLTAPHNKFELSAFTEQSKLFGNDFTAPSIGENSGRIDVNFSAMQQFNDKDDLLEIEKDLERGTNNMGCHGPFSDRQNMSEYIEVDLNMTHVVKNDEDMSITDTVHSPIHDVSKSASIDKKVSLNKDWVADKENIVINPYAAPCESNFAVNEEPDQVLVFDGKRLTLQPDKPEKDKDYRKTLLPNSSAETPQRKTIVLNVNDDLPNFIDDMLNSKCENSGFSGFQEMNANEDDISETVPVNRIEILPKRKTIHDHSRNISMTQALPTNIICQTAVVSQGNPTKRRTIVFNESTGNISVTESVPVKLLCSSENLPERRRTVVYEDDTGNISITQAVPSNILVNDNPETNNKHKTIIFDDEEDNISVTQALTSNIVVDNKPDKRKTIVFDDDACNVSITQALPANIMLPDRQTQEKRRTIIYEDDTGNISVTQALPTNFVLPNNETNPERRRTVVYEDETGNISVTQALPSNILLERVESGDIIQNIEVEKLPTTQSLLDNIIAKDNDASRRRTIVYEDNTGNISITQAIPTQLIPGYSQEKANVIDPFNISVKKARNHKRTTIVYDNDDDDISMTEAISANVIHEAANKRNTTVFDEDQANISTTLAVSTNTFLLDKLVDSAEDKSIKMAEEMKEKVIDYDVYEQNPKPMGDAMQGDRKTLLFNADNCDSEMSMTEAIPKSQSLIREADKRKTVVYDNDYCDISMKKSIPAELLDFETEMLNKSNHKQTDVTHQDWRANLRSDVIVLQASTTNSEPMSSTSAQSELKTQSIRSESRVTSLINAIEVFEGSAQESADISLLHPILDEKNNQLNLTPSIRMDNDDNVDGEEDAVTQTNAEENEDIIDNETDSVLNTSTITINSGTEDKNFMVQIESEQSMKYKNEVEDNISAESMFYITKDDGEDTQTNRVTNNEEGNGIKSNVLSLKRSPTLSIEFKEEKPEQNDDLQKKLEELKTSVTDSKNNSINNFFGQIVSSDVEDVLESDENVKLRQASLDFKKANDTKELLDMISGFTDDRVSDDDAEPIVKMKSNSENKSDMPEPRRLSFAPNRLSIALSREDLLNNISMAQAALQKSRLALDDSDCPEDDTKDASIDNLSSKKPTRTSNEVVKTLQFDDESISEMSNKSDEKYSPLKKTAFGETAYMNETKSKVIPTYLKDVSDGIKELMLDLVKPVNDNLPFEGGLVNRGVTKNTSTQSTQIQANLIASSQIDVDSDLYSNSEANFGIDEVCALNGGAFNKHNSRCVRSPVKFSNASSEKKSEFVSPRQYSCKSEEQPLLPPYSPPNVLVFDHLNPLNNIQLGSINYSDAHKYNPKKSDEMLCGSEDCFDKNTRENEYEVENVTTVQYGIGSRLNTTPGLVKAHQKDHLSIQSTSSRPLSIDQSTNAISVELKDDEVNTLITMKKNKELLEESSSLTLVDDLECFTTSQDDESDQRKVEMSRSPINTQEQEMNTENMAKSDISIRDKQLEHSKITTKGKKRIYSPADKYKLSQPVDVTPKPIKKMPRISNSPKVTTEQGLIEESQHLKPEKDVTENTEHAVDQNVQTEKKHEKRVSIANNKKPRASFTVQQLITDYHNIDLDSNNIDKQILDTVTPTSENFTSFSPSDVSFSSSKNLNALKDVHSAATMDCQSTHQSSVPGMPSQMNWHPELSSACSSSLSSSDSGVNVIAKIDMLPFMGSHECEWESSSVDTWSFRLLHGRLRLMVRLAHRDDNATQTQVRGDTPVLDITVETVQHDKKNPVATLCVQFACETMRYMVSKACRGTCCATNIPRLLRRCASNARVALRWGRAMHDAKLHLAYTLDNDGNLAMKVANVSLRSVWEVRMRVELVVDDGSSAPWPRAAAVRVQRVVSDVPLRERDLRRLLGGTPRDWGHAPRTIWRMFRYLKHKTRDDDLLLAS